MSIINKGVFDADTMTIRQTGSDWPTAQVITTADVTESSANLYFTNARVVTALIAGTAITIEANGRISSAGGGITPNSNVEGNLRITGTMTANAFASSGFGVPTLSSATNINLSANGANGGAVVIQNSPLRLRSYTTADRGNITAAAGDLIFNSNVNSPQVYNGTTWSTVTVAGPAFGAYADATGQTITSGSQQKVLFQVEEFDTNSNFASSRFTPTVTGYYQLNAQVRLDGASGTGEMMIVLWKNGSEFKRGTNQQGSNIAANFWAMQISSVVYANGTDDYFEIYVQQGLGSNVSVTAVNNPAITWFNGCMLRGA
jgi:hypothetical protein